VSCSSSVAWSCISCVLFVWAAGACASASSPSAQEATGGGAGASEGNGGAQAGGTTGSGGSLLGAGGTSAGGGPAQTGAGGTSIEEECAWTCAQDCPALGGLEVEARCEEAGATCCWLGAPSDPYPDQGEAGIFQSRSLGDLEPIADLPDPLTMLDGEAVHDAADFRIRRKEMMQILEEYTYGHMPPPPGNVSGVAVDEPKLVTTQGGDALYQKMELSFGPEEALGFELGLFLPATEGPAEISSWPVLISLTSNANEGGIGAAAGALGRGYAVATVPYQQLGADSPDYASTGFFPAYPSYDWRDISAWAWGLSRAVDYLMTDPAIDRDKIMITGVSRLGQAVLLAGAFDERIALSAPVAGGMAFRFSGAEMGGGLGQGITEIVDQNTYWFGPRFVEFRNKTPQLPSDQHWLPALTAPRLFIMCNSLEDPYGRAYAAVQAYLGAQPVYEFLGASDHLGLHFRPGGHGATAEDWTAIFDFADQYLQLLPGDRRFDVIPPTEDLP